MTVGIIEVFKIIYVDEKQGDGCLMTGRAIDLLIQGDLKIAMIEDLG
jgi:hypothetical protein